MNDLSKKTEEEISGVTSSGYGEKASGQEYYEKLGIYLLLIYQAYLKKETQLEPEIKSSLFRMVKLNRDFPLKIRMIQMDCLNLENKITEGAWDDTREILFPWEESEVLQTLSEERKKIIANYEQTIKQLLR